MPVTVAKVQGVRQSVSKRYVGNMVGVDDVSLVPRVSGVILEQRFANGDMVKKGQVLFVLEKSTTAPPLYKQYNLLICRYINYELCIINYALKTAH